MGARDLALVGAHERAAVDDELAADVEPVDAVRRRRRRARRRDRRRRRARARRSPRPRGRRTCPARASRCRRGRAPPRRRASPSRSASRAVIAVGPPRPRATSSACLTSMKRSLRSFEADPSTPRPTRTPASSQLAHRRDARAEAEVRRRAVGDAGAGLGEARDLGRGEMDAVRAPDVAVEPAEARRGTRPACSRRAPCSTPPPRPSRRGACAAEAEPARELGRLGHQASGDGERRARRDGDLDPRSGPGLVQLARRAAPCPRAPRRRPRRARPAAGRRPRPRDPSSRATRRGARRARAPPAPPPRQAGAAAREDVVVVEDGACSRRARARRGRCRAAAYSASASIRAQVG